MENIFWQNLITNISWGALIVGGTSWVFRRLIDNFFSHKIEQYKAELTREHTKYQITYEKLHTERAVVIKEIYKKIVKVNKAFRSYMDPLQLIGELTKEEKQKIAIEAVNDFLDYFDQNRIFFEESIAGKIDKIKDIFWDSWHDFMLSIDLRQEDVKEAHKKWGDAWDKLSKQLPEVKGDIENEFRSIIGIK